MRAFAALLDRVAYTPSRLGKLRLLTDYFTSTADPARGQALAAPTVGLTLDAAKPAAIRPLVATGVDSTLSTLTFDAVVDGELLVRRGEEVRPALVLEVVFDSVHQSKRQESGLAMRFPRIHRIRRDKPVAEADRIDSLTTLIAD